MKPQTLRASDGSTLRWIEAGAGEPLVLIHGVGMRAEAWGPQMTLPVRVIALDMPGHGGTSALPEGAELTDYVDWAARAISALGLTPASVAGHSMGALVALGLAVRHPARVRRMALLNGVHRRTPAARAAVVARAEAIASGAFDIEAPLNRWFQPGEDALRSEVAGWLASVDRAGYKTAYRAFSQGDDVFADDLHRIGCPALFLTGSDDPNSTADMARTMAAAAPKGQAVIIEGHRHMVNLTAPEAVNAALSDWLDRDWNRLIPIRRRHAND
jgi:pimeloyl-ACP methyl ester carboxylesterase